MMVKSLKTGKVTEKPQSDIFDSIELMIDFYIIFFTFLFYLINLKADINKKLLIIRLKIM